MEQQSYFIIIPAPIFNDENSSDKEKLLIGLINSLLNEDGYCFASNEYLAEKMKTTPQNISRLLGNLSKKDYLKFQYIRNGTVIKNRKIFPTLPLTKMLIAVNENVNGTVNKNVKESNKVISNKVIKEKINKKEIFIKPTLEELQEFITINHLKINAEEFMDYYDGNGWLVGRNKMKDWKATLRNWHRRNFDNKKQINNPEWLGKEIEQDLATDEEINEILKKYE